MCVWCSRRQDAGNASRHCRAVGIDRMRNYLRETRSCRGRLPSASQMCDPTSVISSDDRIFLYLVSLVEIHAFVSLPVLPERLTNTMCARAIDGCERSYYSRSRLYPAYDFEEVLLFEERRQHNERRFLQMKRLLSLSVRCFVFLDLVSQRIKMLLLCSLLSSEFFLPQRTFPRNR